MIDVPTLIDQLPRLSAYDPGAVGEGGLDPLGFGAVADRIADRLAPGIRARMVNPRFLTLSAVGAIAYQSSHDTVAADGSTVDLAFEWLVVEAMVRHPGDDRSFGLPGSRKAARAKAAGERLSRSTYLNGPRVFGFTGVYRPLSRDVGIVARDDQPADAAWDLVAAWERDCGLSGFLGDRPTTPGGRFRAGIADACKRSLEVGECAAPPTGQLLIDIANRLAPREARSKEKKVLRSLLIDGKHEIRNEITAMLWADPPGASVTQRELAARLRRGASRPTLHALQAAIDYEEASTAIDRVWRRLVAYASQQHGAAISADVTVNSPGLVDVASRAHGLVERALVSIERLDDPDLSGDTSQNLAPFREQLKPVDFFHTLLARHEQVQFAKGKLPWLDQVGRDWIVRTPYRAQRAATDDESWAHPMRVVTMANLLTQTR